MRECDTNITLLKLNLVTRHQKYTGLNWELFLDTEYASLFVFNTAEQKFYFYLLSFEIIWQ